MPVRISYYIDESGHTGDLTRSDAARGFGDQPLFSLVAIGIEDISPVEEAVRKLRRRHRVRMQELKSSALCDKPEFLLDCFRLTCDLNLPYFIEIVDKKFFCCMHIVTFQLLRPF